MSEIRKPKGILVKFFQNSDFIYHLCPNCYEYLMVDECLECGLICEINDIKRADMIEEEHTKLNNKAKNLENSFPLLNRSH